MFPPPSCDRPYLPACRRLSFRLRTGPRGPQHRTRDVAFRSDLDAKAPQVSAILSRGDAIGCGVRQPLRARSRPACRPSRVAPASFDSARAIRRWDPMRTRRPRVSARSALAFPRSGFRKARPDSGDTRLNPPECLYPRTPPTAIGVNRRLPGWPASRWARHSAKASTRRARRDTESTEDVLDHVANFWSKAHRSASTSMPWELSLVCS